MSANRVIEPVIRRAGEGERRWFFGGGLWTWKTTAELTGNELSLVEVEMAKGKMTPLHAHPIAESFYLLQGTIRYHIDGVDHVLEPGDFVMVPAGVAHAFLVESDTSKALSIQCSGACEAFYFGASEPFEGSAQETDFDRIGRSGAENGGITLLGPPPF